jgi:hypothetical protein
MLKYKHMAKGVNNPTEDDKHPGGRPLKFETAAELDLAIQTYFDECDPHIIKHMEASGFNERGQTMWTTREIMTEQRPYTMTGLARAIGLDRKSLLNYKKRDEFFPSIQAAIDRCQEYAEGQLFGPYANGAKFNLINNYRGEYQPWADKHEVDHTTKGQPMPLLGGTTPMVDDEDEPADQADVVVDDELSSPAA